MNPNNMKSAATFLILIMLSACSPGNLDYLQANGEDRWREIGWEPVAYEGFQWGYLGFGTQYGGAKVWWRLAQIPDNGITYSGYLERWGNEIHVYGPRAIDAIRPQ